MKFPAVKINISGMRKIIYLCLLSAALAQPAHAADKIVLQLRWAAQAQFAGYYAAQKNGDYAAENLEVEIRPLVPGGLDVPSLMAGGGIDVGVEWLPVAVLARERLVGGVPLVNIAQPFKYAGYRLACRKESGVRAMDGLRGKKIGHWPGAANYLPLVFLLTKLGINAKINAVDFNPAADAYLAETTDVVAALETRAADCVTAMSYNEVGLIHRQLGEHAVDIFSFEPLGLAALEDGLYVLENRLQDKNFRDAMARFVRASMKGWRWAEENPAEAAALVIESAPALKEKIGNDPLAAEHQIFMMEEIAKLTGGASGALETADYDRTADMMTEAGVLLKPPEGARTSDITHQAGIGGKE